MNKFRAIQQPPSQGPGVEEFTIDRFDGGYRGDIPARLLGPDESPDMLDVRFEKGGMQKAYGASDIGVVAGQKILGIIEHGFYDPDAAATVVRLLRFTRVAGTNQGKLEILNGSTWAEDSLAQVSSTVADAVAVTDDFVSMVSVGLTGNIDPSVDYKPGALFITSLGSTSSASPGSDGRILVRKETLGTPTDEADDFLAGNFIDVVLEVTDVTISPAAPVLNFEYEVFFETITTFIAGVSEIEITVSLYVDGELEGTKVHTHTVDGSIADSFTVQNSTASNFELEFTKLVLDADIVDRASTTPIEGVGDVWNADRVFVDPALDDLYTFNYDVQTSPSGGIDVNFYSSEDGIVYDFLGTRSYPPDFFITGETQSFGIASLDGSSKFRYEFVETGSTSGLFVVEAHAVTWQEVITTPDYTAGFHGFNKATDLDANSGVEWREEAASTVLLHYIDDPYIWDPLATPPAGETENPIPAPSYIFAFGDRMIALRNGGDAQYISASADGIAENWIFDVTLGGFFGAYANFLVDTRSDPVDPLMAGAPLTNDIAAIFRERSIMRAFESGNVQVPIGVQHWVEELGTLSPWSVQAIKGGVMFLGHDRMVYLLTESGPIPVGESLHLDLLEATFDPGLVEAFYDNELGEYWLGVPISSSAITRFYIFDVKKFELEQKIRWRIESADSVSRPIFANQNY